jgi:hypothetical protein
MTVTFQATASQRAQISFACRQAGIACEPGEITGTLLCRFDDAVELIVWHAALTARFAWAPMDHEIAVGEEEQTEGIIDVEGP